MNYVEIGDSLTIKRNWQQKADDVFNHVRMPKGYLKKERIAVELIIRAHRKWLLACGFTDKRISHEIHKKTKPKQAQCFN